MSNNALNIQQIIAVAQKLQHMKDQVVFVGGSTTALLVDTVASGSARQTEDVDFIVDITVIGNKETFESSLRELGFTHDISEDAPICRWRMDFNGISLKVDAMPTDGAIYGFHNQH
ncbi:MAG: hypothetical protein JKY66_10285 [Spongiibacteraceae bacterium]|nr:hypothetical protein [Spongiibacteraceae bacterium]